MSATDWHLRPAVPEDADMLALVGAATFLDTFAGVLDGTALLAHCTRNHHASAYASLLDGGATAWIATAAIGGAPIGYAVSAEPTLAQAAPGDRELRRIYCLSRFHGSGLGSTLIGAVIDDACRRRAPRLLLGVYAQNVRARAFYARQGFVQIGTRRFAIGDMWYDDVVLARTLSGVAAV